MKYQIQGKNIEVTDAIKSAIEKKLARMDKYFVINDDLDACVEEVHELIQGEHRRVSRSMELIDEIREELKEFNK